MNKKAITTFLFSFTVLASISLGNIVYAQDNTIIKSASELDYPPFSVVTKDGEADGFSVELLKAALEAKGYEVTFYVAPWSQIKQELADGKIQVLPVVGRTPEREPVYDFTFPYLTFYGGIFVREENDSINSVKDLKDKEVIVLNGDNAEEYVRREQVSENIIVTQTYPEAFQLLSEGKHDAIIAQQRLGNVILKEEGITNVVDRARIDEFKQEFTFAVREGDTELLAVLNEGLSNVILDGTFSTLYEKWFDEEPVVEPPSQKETDYLWFVVFGITLAVVIGFGIWRLKRKSVRTKKL